MANIVKQFFISTWEVLEVVFIATVTVFLIRSFLMQPFLVSGASMEPNFSNGNYLIVDEISYRFREPIRGEVIVFRYPKNPSISFIKRIIGLPGERIKGQNGKINVYENTADANGLSLKESYLNSRETEEDFDIWLNRDEYFVMGDNRSASYDSRSWGPLKKENITGIVRLRIFPLSQFEKFTPPNYAVSK